MSDAAQVFDPVEGTEVGFATLFHSARIHEHAPVNLAVDNVGRGDESRGLMYHISNLRIARKVAKRHTGHCTSGRRHCSG